MRKTILALVCQVLFISFVLAQETIYNFHRLTTAEGLSDGTISGIAQDKYGYIWIGTISNLNRYDGYTIKTFSYSEMDSSSLPQGYLRCLYSDKNGNLWIGMDIGLYKYDFRNNHFDLQPGSKDIVILGFAELNKDTLFMATNKGLAIYLEKYNEFKLYIHNGNNAELLKRRAYDLCIYQNSKVFLATDTGLVVVDLKESAVNRIPLSPARDGGIRKIRIDSADNMWITFGYNSGLLLKIDILFSKFKVYDDFSHSPEGMNDNSIADILVDNKGRLWLSTTWYGIVLYDAIKDTFHSFRYDAQQSMSIVANNINSLYQDKQGFIWAGAGGYGISYFHPDINLFHTILPSVNSIPALPNKWCRAFAQDENDNLWLGVVGGLVYYDVKTKRVKLWQKTKEDPNALPHNSIRSLLYDNNHHVWIGTADGVDCINTQTLKKESIQHADSLPFSFYWTMLQDHNKIIWFGTRDGLYFYNPVSKEIHSIGILPELSKYKGIGVRSLYEDSNNRLWIGFNGSGLLMYNASLQQCRYWKRTDSTKPSIPNNYVQSFTEDKNRIIWIGTIGGLTAYDPNKDSFTNYTSADEHSIVRASCLMTDEKNRVWIATPKGLVVLDSARKNFRYFDEEDGLPGKFNEQCAYKMRDGRFVFPSLNGFVLLNPLEYSEKANLPNVYLSSFKVLNKVYNTSVNPEEVTVIDLDPDENFFSLELSGLNYANPRQTWYAYKLSPLNKDWIYTQDRNINYTNVPGGKYVFYFKATTDPNNWNFPAKMLTVHVGTVFYKSWWFLLLLVIITAMVLYALYRYRVNQLLQLQNVRNHISADLHDDIGARLTNINLLSALSEQKLSEPQGTLDFLKRIQEEAQTSGEALDDIVWSINTKNDSIEEITARMRRYAANVSTEQIFIIIFMMMKMVYQ